MSKAYSGVKRIGYSTTKAANIAQIGDTVTVTWLTGKVKDDSNTNPDVITTGTTDGAIFGGVNIAPEWHVLNRTNYDTLLAKMIADTEDYWYLEYFDGRVQVSDVPFNIFVVDSNQTNIEDGADFIRITADKKHIGGVIFKNLPAS
jgi:hypothetical protein